MADKNVKVCQDDDACPCFGQCVKNVTHPSGMVRGSTEGKVNYLLVYDGPLLERWAAHLTNAAPSKGKRNWMHARTEEDLERFREGFARHAVQWLRGDSDEDHAAAIVFNLNGAEYVRAKITLPRECVTHPKTDIHRGMTLPPETTYHLEELLTCLEDAVFHVRALVNGLASDEAPPESAATPPQDAAPDARDADAR